MKRFVLTFSIFYLFALCLCAKPIDDAKRLYREGSYEEAIEKLKPIVKASPRDGTANYYLGMSYSALGEYDSALPYLQKASERGVADANRELAQIAIRQYDMDAADSHIDAWERQLKKDKKEAPESMSELRSEMILIKNMLERVEKIAIIDSLVVDADDFFKHYRLTPDAGRLYDGSVLDAISRQAYANVVYLPENSKEMFWAMEDSAGMLSLASAKVLDDGKVAEEKFFGGDLGQGGDADYPFFMPDGQTFYFASNGENSIGGYDIFLSRRQNDGEILDPQNLGMPYNSPYDDYMLVIDESAGLGWWATDRNQIPGKVTIYVFVPNSTRVNYSADDENLAKYAFVSDIASTSEGVDAESLLSNPRLLASGEVTEKGAPDTDFCVNINGKRYASLSQFRNRDARQAMKQCLESQAELEMTEARLSALRRAYGKGDKSAAQEITTLEKRLPLLKDSIKRLRNKAISLESPN
ncbi:MAG: tetratricopeptide repeat protein [Clostridium sp.]|nr:tetratricopeptide repeat protein [Clostridium sp.]